MKSCMLFIFSVVCAVATGTDASLELQSRLLSGDNSSSASASSASSNTSSETSDHSSGASNTSSDTAADAVVVEAKMEMTMSAAHATSVTDAFAAEETKENVATAMKKSLAGAMTDIEAAHIEIVDIKAATRRLDDTFLRRLNTSDATNDTEAAGSDVTLVVDFEITVPEGKTGEDIVNLATGIDTAALKTSIETNLASEASLTVTVTSLSTPTAEVKAEASDGILVAGAVSSAMSPMQLMLGLVAMLAVGA